MSCYDNESPLNVESIEDNISTVEVISDDIVNVEDSDIGFITIQSDWAEEDSTKPSYIKNKPEPFEWIDIEQSDWKEYGEDFRLIIPFEKHNCLNPYLSSMLIIQNLNEYYESNIPIWQVTSDDSIVILSNDAIKCKVLIKGDR